MVPLLIGPIIGPLLGGGLAQAFGWRSTFICLTVFAGVNPPPIQLNCMYGIMPIPRRG